jgi:hypothetical protein
MAACGLTHSGVGSHGPQPTRLDWGDGGLAGEARPVEPGGQRACGQLGLEVNAAASRHGSSWPSGEKRSSGKYDPLTRRPTCQVQVGALELGLLQELSLKLELQKVGSSTYST